MKALANGGTQRTLRDGSTVLSHVLWNVAGNCQNPRTVEYWSRPEGTPKVVIGEGLPKMWQIEMECPCRTKCANCLKRRGGHWQLRALAEWRAAPRTWLTTLTFNPQCAMELLNRTRLRLSKAGLDFDALSDEQKIAERHRESGAMVTLALKRLRKGGNGAEPARFRYMCVLEAHASGVPHYHLMIHEVDAQIKHRTLTRIWPHGFTNAKLVSDQRGASYAGKYLSKSACARVRASAEYGSSCERPQDIAKRTERESSHSLTRRELGKSNQ